LADIARISSEWAQDRRGRFRGQIDGLIVDPAGKTLFHRIDHPSERIALTGRGDSLR